MALVQTLSFPSFRDMFIAANREDTFTDEGLEVLYDYLDNLSDETGKDIEIDVVGLCSEYDENTIEQIISENDIDVSDIDPDDEDEIKDCVREYLEDNTTIVGETSDGFVYVAF